MEISTDFVVLFGAVVRFLLSDQKPPAQSPSLPIFEYLFVLLFRPS